MPQDCAGFWFIYATQPPVHIRPIYAGGCDFVSEPKDKQSVELFFAEDLKCLSACLLESNTADTAKHERSAGIIVRRSHARACTIRFNKYYCSTGSAIEKMVPALSGIIIWKALFPAL